MPSVLIIINSKLNKEKINATLIQDMLFQPEGTGRGTSGRNTGIDKFEFSLREPCLQPIRNHWPVTIHLSD
jgi:hypothetical protein